MYVCNGHYIFFLSNRSFLPKERFGRPSDHKIKILTQILGEGGGAEPHINLFFRRGANLDHNTDFRLDVGQQCQLS